MYYNKYLIPPKGKSSDLVDLFIVKNPIVQKLLIHNTERAINIEPTIELPRATCRILMGKTLFMEA